MSVRWQPAAPEKNMQDGARLRAQHRREVAAHFRSLADVEPAASLRRQLQRLAARHDQLAADLEELQ
jgi:hypothetical protein